MLGSTLWGLGFGLQMEKGGGGGWVGGVGWGGGGWGAEGAPWRREAPPGYFIFHHIPLTPISLPDLHVASWHDPAATQMF